MLLPLLCCSFITFLARVSTEEASAFITMPTSDLDTYKTFTSRDSSNYKTLKLISDTLFVGARDRVFGQAADDITSERFTPVSWEGQGDSCDKVQQSNDGKKCYNLIQVIQPLNASHLLICGTNALSPKNMLLVKTDDGYKLHNSMINSPLCSFDPDDSISSLAMPLSDGRNVNSIFSSPRLDFQAQISIVKTVPDSVLMCNEKMQEESTSIVSSFAATDDASSPRMSKVYYVSDEKAQEPNFQGKKATTITQVCANDIGGKRILSNEWTSLLKVRLKCLTDEESPLTFDLVTDAVKGDDDMIYGTFATRHETYRTSAVCAFRLSDVQTAFRESPFLEKTSGSYQSVPSPEDSLRPGMCAYRGMIKDKPDASTSKDFPEKHLTFMLEHNLISRFVEPAYPSSGKTPLLKGPLLSKTEDTFKKIAVQLVKDLGGTTHTEIFVGTQKGWVQKFVTVVKDKTVESVELFKIKISSTPVISMKLSKKLGMLYVGTDSDIKQISTASCEAYTKTCKFCDPCRMCILSRDPSCAWDVTIQKCVSIKDKDASTSDLLQDVKYGRAVTQCKVLSNSSLTVIEKTVAEGSSEIIGHVVTNPIITATWRKVKDSKIKQQINSENRKTEKKYRITKEGQLEISNFAAGMDASTYECEYSIKDAIVAKADYVLRSFAAPISSTTPVIAVSITTSAKVFVSNKTGGIGREGGGTFIPTSNPFDPVKGSMYSTVIPIIVVLCVLIVIAICVLVYYRNRTALRKCFGLSKQEYRPKSTDEAVISETNGTTPTEQVDGNQVNRTNNNNAQGRISNNRDDAQTTPLLLTNTPSSESVNKLEIVEEDGIKCKKRNAKSYDDIDNLDYIDEMEPNQRRNVTLEQSSSLREEGKRRRIPPARTKSMPMSSFYVVYAGKKLMCNSLQRKGGKWVLELPDQSGMSGMAGDDVIDFYDDQEDGIGNQFNSSKDDTPVTGNMSPQHDDTLHYVETPDRDNMTAARKAFFHGDRSNNYVTSTPNRSGLSDSLAKCNKSNTDALIKLPKKDHRRLREQTSEASLRSHISTDSDSTVKGSNTTLKQEETPTAGRHNSTNHKHTQSKRFPITIPTSDNVNNRQEETNIHKSQKCNKSLDSSSTGSSDGDDNLHGSNKSRNRRSKKAPDSPSKESRTSQESSSSNSSNYKSARSSMVMPP